MIQLDGIESYAIILTTIQETIGDSIGLKVDHLDDYSLKHILSFLTLKEKLLIAELVCKRWQTLVCELLAQEITTICFGYAETFYKWCNTKRHLNFDNHPMIETAEYPKLNPHLLPNVLKKFPNIKCVTISDWHQIDVDFFLSIKSAFHKLECLHLCYVKSLDITTCDDLKSRNVSGELTQDMRVKWTQLVEVIGHKLLDFTVNCDLNNEVIKMFIDNSPKLQELVLYGMISDDIFDGMSDTVKTVELFESDYQFQTNTTSLINNLAKSHSNQLTQIYLSIPFTIKDLKLIGEHFSNLSKLSINIDEVEMIIPSIDMISKLKNLKNLNLNFYSRPNTYSCDYYLLSLLKNGSKSIRTFYLNNAYLSTNTLSEICERMPQIENLILCNIERDEYCTHDQKLDSCDDCKKEDKFWEFLMNLRNIRKLFICGTPVSKIVFKHILLLKNLEYLELDYMIEFGINFLSSLIEYRLVNTIVKVKVKAISNSGFNITQLKFRQYIEFKLFEMIAKTNKIKFESYHSYDWTKNLTVHKFWWN